VLVGFVIFAFEGKDWNFMIGNEAGGDVILGGKWVTGNQQESAPAALVRSLGELFLLSRGSKPPSEYRLGFFPAKRSRICCRTGISRPAHSTAAFLGELEKDL